MRSDAMRSDAAVVQVAVPRPLRRTFDYAAPDDRPIAPGVRVRVPFGRSSVVGVVTGNRASSPHPLKPLDEVLDETPLLSADLIDLAAWLASYYHHPVGDVYATLLPAKARQGAPAKRIDDRVWQAVDDVDADAALSRAPQQRWTFQRLRELGRVADAELAAVGVERRHLTALQRKGLARASVVPASSRNPVATPEPQTSGEDIEPTAAQAAAIDAIVASLGKPATHLLDGVTGSGKTEVYLRAIAAVLQSGAQALVLVPEIALTPQTLTLFKQRFGTAATLHSAVSDAQRFDIWLKCAAGEHKVLIGTRSAVFTPFANLGIIVVDEEHDASFKQQDGLRYSARDVAVKRGRALSIPVVLGSATPSLDSLENAQRRRYRYLRLPQRAGGASLPAYRIHDVANVRLDRGFSPQLHAAIERHLDAGNQVLVFINRRGYAPVLFCPKCTWQAHCKHCDAKLTYHQTPHQLRCHHCDRRQAPPNRCPECGTEELITVGTGTQRAEEALAERHPQVPLYRIDRDTTRSTRRLQANLAAVREGSPAILVGTQMLAKGHHFPKMTLVVVLNADAGFLSADFRAPERTAQLIEQVAGRAGRADLAGEVWIQTHDPKNANLTALTELGYRGFARHERQLRADAKLPPFGALAIIRADGRSADAVTELLNRAAQELMAPGVELLGPAPAPIARRSDRHHAQLLAVAEHRTPLHEALTRLEQAELKAPGVRWSIDVDPMDTF